MFLKNKNFIALVYVVVSVPSYPPITVTFPVNMPCIFSSETISISPSIFPCSVRMGFPLCITALRISGRRTRELARGGGCPLQPLDGLARQRRDRKRMVIRSADGSVRSVRAIVCVSRAGNRWQFGIRCYPASAGGIRWIKANYAHHIEKFGICLYRPINFCFNIRLSNKPMRCVSTQVHLAYSDLAFGTFS